MLEPEQWTYELLMKKNTKESLVHMVLDLQQQINIIREIWED